MKKIVVVFILLIIGFSVQAQKYKQSSSEYKDKFDIEFGEDERILKTWYHYVITKKGKSYILRLFHPDRKLMTQLITYSNRKLTIRNGEYKKYNEANNGVTIGQYRNGRRFGHWIIVDAGKNVSGSFVGDYNKNGQKNGTWKRFDNEKRLESLIEYDNGKRIKAIRYDSLGKIAVPKIKKPDDVLDFVEQMPEFPGGQNELLKFLGRNIEYPKKAQELGVEGRAIVNFVLSEKGVVQDVYVVRGICKEIEDECRRVIKKMPNWKPGVQNSKKVKVAYTLPILFSLGD